MIGNADDTWKCYQTKNATKLSSEVLTTHKAQALSIRKVNTRWLYNMKVEHFFKVLLAWTYKSQRSAIQITNYNVVVNSTTPMKMQLLKHQCSSDSKHKWFPTPQRTIAYQEEWLPFIDLHINDLQSMALWQADIAAGGNQMVVARMISVQRWKATFAETPFPIMWPIWRLEMLPNWKRAGGTPCNRKSSLMFVKRLFVDNQ